jgi:hypothetical protein
LPDTLAAFVTSRTEDFLIQVAVADNEALYAFVIDRSAERAEIDDVSTSVVYEHVRNDRIASVCRATFRAKPGTLRRGSHVVKKHSGLPMVVRTSRTTDTTQTDDDDHDPDQ